MRDQFVRRHELFIVAAVLAAHATSPAGGFRQRDVKFLLDLFRNWVESSLNLDQSAIQNTQLSRYLGHLVKEGHARSSARGVRPLYRLTRLGLLECLNRLAQREGGRRPEHFFFVYYFLGSYAPRIEELIRREGTQFPPALRWEIRALLDVKTLVRNELQQAEQELRRTVNRAEEARRASALATKLFAQSIPLSEVVEMLEEKYPFELSSQKPLGELIGGIPPDLAQWELTNGNRRRADVLWEPALGLMKRYVEELRKLESSSEEAGKR